MAAKLTYLAREGAKLQGLRRKRTAEKGARGHDQMVALGSLNNNIFANGK